MATRWMNKLQKEIKKIGEMTSNFKKDYKKPTYPHKKGNIDKIEISEDRVKVKKYCGKRDQKYTWEIYPIPMIRALNNQTTKTDFSKLDHLPIDDIEKLLDMDILELKNDYICFTIPVDLTIPYGESYLEIKVGEEHVGKPLRDINNNKSLQEQIKIYNEIVDMIDNNKLTQEEINELKKQGYIDITTDKHEIIVNRDFTKFTQRFPYQPGLVLGYLQTDNGKICTFRDNVHMYH